MTLGIAIALVLGAVLAAILVEAYKSRMRRANPYSKPTRAVPAPEPLMNDHILASKPEVSANDVHQAREWDIKWAVEVNALLQSTVESWKTHAIDIKDAHLFNGSWIDNVTNTQKSIGAARTLTAYIHDENDGNVSVRCGQSKVAGLTRAEATDLQFALNRGLADIMSGYVARRLSDLRDLIAPPPAAVLPDTLPVVGYIQANGGGNMYFRTTEEATRVVGGLNALVQRIAGPYRERLVQRALVLIDQHLAKVAPKSPAFHD